MKIGYKVGGGNNFPRYFVMLGMQGFWIRTIAAVVLAMTSNLAVAEFRAGLFELSASIKASSEYDMTECLDTSLTNCARDADGQTYSSAIQLPFGRSSYFLRSSIDYTGLESRLDQSPEAIQTLYGGLGRAIINRNSGLVLQLSLLAGQVKVSTPARTLFDQAGAGAGLLLESRSRWSSWGYALNLKALRIDGADWLDGAIEIFKRMGRSEPFFRVRLSQLDNAATGRSAFGGESSLSVTDFISGIRWSL